MYEEMVCFQQKEDSYSLHKHMHVCVADPTSDIQSRCLFPRACAGLPLQTIQLWRTWPLLLIQGFPMADTTHLCCLQLPGVSMNPQLQYLSEFLILPHTIWPPWASFETWIKSSMNLYDQKISTTWTMPWLATTLSRKRLIGPQPSLLAGGMRKSVMRWPCVSMEFWSSLLKAQSLN